MAALCEQGYYNIFSNDYPLGIARILHSMCKEYCHDTCVSGQDYYTTHTLLQSSRGRRIKGARCFSLSPVQISHCANASSVPPRGAGAVSDKCST